LRNLLDALHKRRGKAPATLHSCKQLVERLSVTERADKKICRGNGVLNGKVDPNATHWRHRVRSVTDRQKAWSVPALQPIEAHLEQVQLIERLKVACNGTETRLESLNVCYQGSDAAFSNCLRFTFRQHECALPVSPTVYAHEDLSAFHGDSQGPLLPGPVGKLEPEYVYWGPQVLHRQQFLAPNDAAAAVASEHKPR
jgi:hypothetical protein